MCEVCAVAKPDCPKPKARIIPLYFKKSNGLLCIDFLTLGKASPGVENVFILTDVFSQFSKTITTDDRTAQIVVRILIDHWFNAVWSA